MALADGRFGAMRRQVMPFCIPKAFCPQACSARPHKCGWYFLIAALLASFAVVPARLQSEPIRPLVMATDQPDTTYEGRWLRRAYEEAFKRLDVPIEVTVMPTPRVTAMVDSGAVDGQFLRVFAYADAHPEQVRVEEPLHQVVFGLWASNPALNLSRLGDLTATGWIGIYRRGVEHCQKTLSGVLPGDRLSSVSTPELGLQMLLAGRVDFYCELDASVLNALYLPEFKNVTSIRPLLMYGDPIALHPYLNKKHADLAGRLAAALKQMKADGSLERFQREAKYELTGQ
jgi:polar amino acid transport system substrate-binding protein